MKRTLRSYSWPLVAVTLLLCLTAPVFADTQFAITSTTGSLWGEYTSPYGTNNAAVGSVICDDFVDTTYIGQNYHYNQVSANSLIQNGGGVWGGNTYGNAQTLYAAAAYLALQIFSSTNLTTQQYENWAMWALFDPTHAVAAMNSGGVTAAGCDAIFGSNAYNNGSCHAVPLGSGGLITTAISVGLGDYNNGLFDNLVVYLPQTNLGQNWCGQAGSCASQEFFGQQVPDGGSALLYLVLAGFSCFGAIFLTRNRTTHVGLS